MQRHFAKYDDFENDPDFVKDVMVGWGFDERTAKLLLRKEREIYDLTHRLP